MGAETPLKVSLVTRAPIVRRDPIKNYTSWQLVPIRILPMQEVSPSVLFKGYYILANMLTQVFSWSNEKFLMLRASSNLDLVRLE